MYDGCQIGMKFVYIRSLVTEGKIMLDITRLSEIWLPHVSRREWEPIIEN